MTLFVSASIAKRIGAELSVVSLWDIPLKRRARRTLDYG
jgi:hypothetical protein